MSVKRMIELLENAKQDIISNGGDPIDVNVAFYVECNDSYYEVELLNDIFELEFKYMKYNERYHEIEIILE